MFWTTVGVLNREFGDFRRIAEECQNQFSNSGFPAEDPALNVYGNESELVVAVELPGVDPDSIRITLTDKLLTLDVDRKLPEIGEEDSVSLQERPVGGVKRRIRLPFTVRDEDVSASCRDGILKITLPRVEAEKSRVIKVETN